MFSTPIFLRSHFWPFLVIFWHYYIIHHKLIIFGFLWLQRGQIFFYFSHSEIQRVWNIWLQSFVILNWSFYFNKSKHTGHSSEFNLLRNFFNILISSSSSEYPFFFIFAYTFSSSKLCCCIRLTLWSAYINIWSYASSSSSNSFYWPLYYLQHLLQYRLQHLQQQQYIIKLIINLKTNFIKRRKHRLIIIKNNIGIIVSGNDVVADIIPNEDMWMIFLSSNLLHILLLLFIKSIHPYTKCHYWKAAAEKSKNVQNILQKASWSI